jgi:hypothetical protein
LLGPKARLFCLLGLACSALADAPGCGQAPDPGVPALRQGNIPLGSSLISNFNIKKHRTSFVLWQLPPQSRSQQMSYIVFGVSHSVIVVDGGWEGPDETYLRRFIGALGGKVSLWLLSHPHPDHAGALAAILKKPAGIRIDRVLHSPDSLAWVKANEASYLPFVTDFYGALEKSGVPVTEASVGDELKVDEMRVEVLAIRNPEITSNAINNSSMVVRVSDPEKSVLFLGDLGLEGGKKLLASPERAKLPSDYVQMAHHGQAAVDRAFYEAVAPHYCLWPTPEWLWEDDGGTGPGSGRWGTLQTRQWMTAFEIKAQYVAGFRLTRIE